MASTKQVVEGYLNQKNWKVKENSNSPYSYGGLSKHLSSEVSKEYWLSEVYPDNIEVEHRSGALHLHDLGGLTLYCCGYSLQSIIATGVKGVPNIPTSAPAKHFASILNQVSNLVTIFQNEIMGAVALNSFDTLLAPFVKNDALSYEEVRQAMQNFVYSVNSNTRAGAEPAFFNLTFDLTPPTDMIDNYASGGGTIMDFKYGDCQAEMDMINKAFYELMLEGDAEGKPFAYPIPTYNIHERFDFENPNNDLLWEMAGKYGYPYFANFINSDMDISDARSMCCRLRLDLKELRRKNGGLFGSGDNTGSIG
jgi:ribonucleoside-triphosphate reductase